MSDLVQKLVGALERLLPIACDSTTHPELSIEILDARAALSAAKDGGWVLPEGKRLIVVDDSFDQLIYWVDRTVSKGNANSDIKEAYEAWTGWDTWPLPNPPKGEV